MEHKQNLNYKSPIDEVLKELKKADSGVRKEKLKTWAKRLQELGREGILNEYKLICEKKSKEPFSVRHFITKLYRAEILALAEAMHKQQEQKDAENNV